MVMITYCLYGTKRLEFLDWSSSKWSKEIPGNAKLCFNELYDTSHRSGKELQERIYMYVQFILFNYHRQISL